MVGLQAFPDLGKVALAAAVAGGFPGADGGNQNDGGQDAEDGDGDEDLDEGEGFGVSRLNFLLEGRQRERIERIGEVHVGLIICRKKGKG